MNENTLVENTQQSLTNREFEAVISALEQAIDPEMGISVEDLGLIYSLQATTKDDDRQLHIIMALTMLGCPLSAELQTIVEQAVLANSSFKKVFVQIDPRIDWDPKRMSRVAKMTLGIL